MRRIFIPTLVLALAAVLISISWFNRNDGIITNEAPSSDSAAVHKPNIKNKPELHGQDKAEPDIEAEQQMLALIEELDIEEVALRTSDSDVELNRMVAQLTVHMSDAEMVKLQSLRNGLVVRNWDGSLNSPYELEEECKTIDLCKAKIFNERTKEMVWDDNGWVKGFRETGVGQEVVKS